VINAAFGVDDAVSAQWATRLRFSDISSLQHVSHAKAGVSDIYTEITSSQNDHFVLHDSQGFAAGEEQNFLTVSTFIKEREQKRNIAEKLHAIW
jgi:hypothetical protein